jgi:hypothetical protein
VTDKKLFTVSVSLEFQMPVLAESASAALKIAHREVEDEARNFTASDYDITCIDGAKFTDDVWDSLIYGADGDETVNECVKRLGLKTPVDEWKERMTKR